MIPQIKQRITQLNNGEIPEGYKKTEFGVFPCDWVTDKTYGDLFDFFGGLSKSREELGEEGYPYLHYGDLHRGSFNSVSYEQYNELPKCDVKLKGNDSFLMDDGDVAFLDASEDLEGTSRAVLIDNPDNKPFVAGLHIIYGKSKDEGISKWYKQYITSSESTKKQFQKLASGFKVYGLNRDTLAKIQIAYPASKTEQEKIAEILMKWDEAIELQEKYVEKLKNYKSICSKKMFPAHKKNIPEWRFKGFTEAWEQRKFEEIAERTSTMSSAPDLPRVEYEDIISGTGRLNKDIAKKESSKSGIEFHDGDVLYGKLRPYLQNWLLPTFSGLAVGDFWVLQPQNMDSAFLYRLIQSSRFDEIANQSTGTKMPRADWKLVSKTEFAVPSSIAEQAAIGSFFCNLDNLITLHQRKVEIIKHQRKALQQYLLNGIVRVKA